MADSAYLAGFFDGEGTVGVYVPYAAVVMAEFGSFAEALREAKVQ